MSLKMFDSVHQDEPKITSHKNTSTNKFSQSIPFSKIDFISGSYGKLIFWNISSNDDDVKYEIIDQAHDHWIKTIQPIEKEKYPGYIITASVDGKIKFWSLKNMEEKKCIKTIQPRKQNSWIEKVKFFDNNKIVITVDNMVKIYDIKKEKFTKTFTGHKRDIKDVIVMDKDVMVTGTDNSIKYWNINKGKCLKTLNPGSTYSLCKIDNKIFASGMDSSIAGCSIKIWDFESGKCVGHLDGHKSEVRDMMLMENKCVLVSASSDSNINLYDFEKRKRIAVLTDHEESVASVKMISDSIICSCSYDKTIKVWDIEKNRPRCVKTLDNVHTAWITSFCHLKQKDTENKINQLLQEFKDKDNTNTTTVDNTTTDTTLSQKINEMYKNK